MTSTSPDFERGSVEANGLDIAYLATGPEGGPLALCLHGFPDTANTYRYLLPRLAAAGHRAVAPFSRGYAPTGVPADGRFQTGALASDANAIHAALGGGPDAVVIGHDWGAHAANGAAGAAPDRWRKVVTMALPVGPALMSGFFSYEQLKRSFYVYFFQSELADVVVAADDLDFIARIWADWSPGYDATADLEDVRNALGSPENLGAALGYYRAMFDPSGHDPGLEREQAAAGEVPPQPMLYLHGANDGCIGAEMADAARPMLGPGSDVSVIKDVGHFLHLERPDEVNDLIVDFVSH